MNPTGGPPPLPMDHPEPPPNLAPDPGPDALFAHWAPASPGFDEAFADPHTPRTHWQPILAAIGGLGPDELRQRQAQIARMRHEHGASFNPFDDPGDGHAPWELDPLPLPLPPEEWRSLEKGLVQRAVLLDAVLEDLYGPQRLLAAGLRTEDRGISLRAGRGVGAVEVPRGILYHEYELDANGLCVKANCVIPTGQNLANIDRDLRARVPQILDRSREEIALDLEMLVRAYDPCISCSAHFLDVEFTHGED